MMDQLLSKQMKQKRHKITSNYEFHNMVQLGVGVGGRLLLLQIISDL